MFRFTAAWLTMIRESTLKYSANELNKMLEKTSFGSPNMHSVHEDIKRFISANVTPILHCSTLDRRGNSTEMRKLLCQLTRDSAFAAAAMRARPNSTFVRSIVDCIQHDSQNMQFVCKMSSPQSTKIVEYLCKVGVRDTDVFPILISRLNFSNVREVARVLFALAEADLHEINVFVVIPLYCGERFSAVELLPRYATGQSGRETTDSHHSSSSNGGNNYDDQNFRNYCSNVYDAVRALRGLSKSVRIYVERSRSREGSARGQYKDDDEVNNATVGTAAATGALEEAFPMESFNMLRNAIVSFLFANADVLRGAHWINIARAMAYFPIDVRVLKGIGADPVIVEALEKEKVGAVATLVERRSSPSSTATAASPYVTITCEDVVSLCVSKVFQYKDVHDTAKLFIGKDSTGEAAEQDGGFSEPTTTMHTTDTLTETNILTNVKRYGFDCKTQDLLKIVPLIPLIRDEKLRERRFDDVMETLVSHFSSLNLAEVVQLLQYSRQMPHTSRSDHVVSRLVAEISRRLSFNGTNHTAQDILVNVAPLRTIVVLGTALSALRIRRCDGFVSFLCAAASDQRLHLHLSPDDAVALVNGLSSAAQRDPIIAVALNALIERTLGECGILTYSNIMGQEDASATTTAAAVHVQASHCLLAQYPAQVAKLLRSYVLLNATLSMRAVYGIFGSTGFLRISNISIPGNNDTLVFDLSRSLLHLGTQSRGTFPETEQVLWDRGVMNALLPIIVGQTTRVAQRVGRTFGALLPSSYIPAGWRTTLEAVSSFVDVRLDTLTFDAMQKRLTEVYPPCRQLLSDAVIVTAAQLRSQVWPTGRESTAVARSNFQRIHFRANAATHLISALLMHEHIIFQAAYHGRTRAAARGSGSLSTPAAETSVGSNLTDVQGIRRDYMAWLNAPVGSDGTGPSPMDVLRSVFGKAALDGTDGALADRANQLILSRENTLEITTSLPFAVSLVLDPGPVNEFFTEHSVPLMLQEDA